MLFLLPFSCEGLACSSSTSQDPGLGAAPASLHPPAWVPCFSPRSPDPLRTNSVLTFSKNSNLEPRREGTHSWGTHG